MKKFKFFAIIFAALVAVSQLCACGDKKDKDDDDDNDKKSEKTSMKGDDKKSVDTEKEMTIPRITGTPSLDDDDMMDFDTVMSYLEANADSFFPGFNRVMQPIRTAIDTNTPPTQTQANQLEAFVDANEDYIEALGALIGHEQASNFTPEQESRIQAFANRNSAGLENLGVLIGLGMLAE